MGLVVQSTWMDVQSARDTTAWRSSLSSLGERDASVGARNDAEALHLVFTTTDPGLRERITDEGFFFWFDPFGGERRFFGIRYPVAWSAVPASGDNAGGDNAGPRGSGWGKPGDEMEIYTDGFNEHERVAWKDAGGISVQLLQLNDTLRCEITVPLRQGPQNPYALGAAPGDLIGVGFETRDLLRSGGQSAGSVGRSRRGRGASSGSGVSGSGSAGGAAPGSEIPFRVWTKVQLSSR